MSLSLQTLTAGRSKIYWALLLSLFVAALPTAHGSTGIDLDDLKAHLTTDGLVGSVHGAVDNRDLFVFTYRSPTDFFSHVELPLTTSDSGVRGQMKNLKRHQVVRIFGDFVDNKAPRKHIDLTKLILVNDYASVEDQYPYRPKANVSELFSKEEFIGRVHAIDPSGKVLVVEYKDLVVPVFISQANDIDFVKKLYRGDKIRIRYKVQPYPKSPVHLRPKNASELGGLNALERIEAVVDLHGKKLTEEGYLVLFPKSPQIASDVYALLIEDPEGSTMQMTLANLINPTVFKQLNAKFHDEWTRHSSMVENGRNKLVNRGVIVRATGTGNVVDPGQANPQLLIDSVDQVSFK